MKKVLSLTVLVCMGTNLINAAGAYYEPRHQPRSDVTHGLDLYRKEQLAHQRQTSSTYGADETEKEMGEDMVNQDEG
jgi:hypothetical protein